MKPAIGFALAAAGCLGPRVSDDPPAASSGILAAGATVPSADDDAALDARIAAGDQVAGTVPLLSSFAGGAPAHAWDFGAAPAFAMPVFVLVQSTGPDEYQRIDHPPIVEAVPGDASYSPFGSLFYVEVTASYDGSLLTSSSAVQEAVARGLVLAPFVAQHGVCQPIVAKDVVLDVGTGAPLAPATRAFYKGESVRYYDFGDVPLTDGVDVATLPRYVLHRDGDEPLSEPLRHVDMDGDGDIDDSNDIYDLRPADDGYSPRRQTIDVAVPASVASIDTSQNETIADLKDATQLFDPAAVIGTVIAYDTTTDDRAMPQQRTAGGL